MEMRKILTLSVLMILVTSGMLSAVGTVRSKEENKKLNDDPSESSTNKQQVEVEIDKRTLEKGRIALKDEKVREVLKDKYGFDERTIEKTSETLEEEQDGQGSEEYEPKVDPATLVKIVKAGALLYDSAYELLTEMNVDSWYDIDDTFVGAQVNDVTFHSWDPFTDSVSYVEKYLPAWQFQKVEGWYHENSLTSYADVYLNCEYVWEGSMRTVMTGQVPGGPGSSLQDYCDRTVPSDDPSENEDGLRFWWWTTGYINADLGHQSGDPPGGGGGGCPYITTWDGERYSPENNILWQSNDKIGARDEMDVTDHYILDELPERDGKYSIRLKELGNDISYIEDTKMMAIDKPKDTDIAVTQNGEVITYDGFIEPNKIKTNIDTPNTNQETNILTSQDGESIKVAPGDEITLDYSSKLQSLNENEKVLLVPMSIKSAPTNLKVSNDGNEWRKVESFLPRSKGGIQAIDLTSFSEKEKIKKVKLEFNGKHRISTVGFADIADKSYEVQELDRIRSKRNKVKGLNDDEIYAKLTPEDEGITLNYEIPEKKKSMERELMFAAEGFYNRHVPKESVTEGVQVKSRPNGTVYTPILDSYDDVEKFLWRFDDETTSTKFRPQREAKGGNYHKGTLTVVYDDWRTKTFNIK